MQKKARKRNFFNKFTSATAAVAASAAAAAVAALQEATERREEEADGVLSSGATCRRHWGRQSMTGWRAGERESEACGAFMQNKK